MDQCPRPQVLPCCSILFALYFVLVSSTFQTSTGKKSSRKEQKVYREIIFKTVFLGATL